MTEHCGRPYQEDDNEDICRSLTESCGRMWQAWRDTHFVVVVVVVVGIFTFRAVPTAGIQGRAQLVKTRKESTTRTCKGEGRDKRKPVHTFCSSCEGLVAAEVRNGFRDVLT
jgi:hypothetical protein